MNSSVSGEKTMDGACKIISQN